MPHRCYTIHNVYKITYFLHYCSRQKCLLLMTQMSFNSVCIGDVFQCTRRIYIILFTSFFHICRVSTILTLYRETCLKGLHFTYDA